MGAERRRAERLADRGSSGWTVLADWFTPRVGRPAVSAAAVNAAMTAPTMLPAPTPAVLDKPDQLTPADDPHGRGTESEPSAVRVDKAHRTQEAGREASPGAVRRGLPQRVMDELGGFSLRMAERVEEGRGPGFYAVLALIVSPCAVFLFAAYSEALFLALAVPAWLLAKKGRWELAVLFAAGASVVRITGFFLALGLVVEFLVGENGRKAPGGWRLAPYLITPFLSIGAYMAYQWHRTGDWTAWSHAQKIGWNRSMVSPLQSFETTWNAAFHTDNEWTNAFRVEIAAAAVGVLLVAWLLYQAQWPEAVYVGTQLAALMVSQYYLSIGRATLVWFPLWIALGHLALRRRWLYNTYLALALPLMGAFVLSFTQGQWTG